MEKTSMHALIKNFVTAGIDTGDRTSAYCILDYAGKVNRRGSFGMSPRPFQKHIDLLRKLQVDRVVLEVGTHSPWMSRKLQEAGFEVIVANPRKVQLISKSNRKTDQVDAELLARLGRADPSLLSPIQHRGPRAQADLGLLRARSALVDNRTQLINHIRGAVKSWGCRLPSCSTNAFHKKMGEFLPVELRETLSPLIELIGALSCAIAAYDKRIETVSLERYPETKMLRQIKGVGSITALCFVLTIESPDRIHKIRNIGAFLGMIPREYQSGSSKPQLRITKAGDETLRSLLVCCAQYILGPFGDDCDLRRHGLRIATIGGKGAKKRAVIAVARKLAILLLRLWQTGEEYEPLRNCLRRGESAGAVA